MNRECNLTKRVQTAQGWRYCPVVLSSNGRVKPDVVLVNGKPGQHSEGSYYLEWREGSKRVRLSVGKDGQNAAARRVRKEAELNAVNNGVAVVPENRNGHGVLLADAIRDFLDEKRIQRKPKTYADYDAVLRYFQQSCPKQHLADFRASKLVPLPTIVAVLQPHCPFSYYAR